MILITNGEALSSRNTQKRFFWHPSGSQTHDLPDTGLMLQPSIYHLFTFIISTCWACSMAGHMSRTQEPSIWPSSPRVSHSSVVGASNRCLDGHGFYSRWGLRKFFLSISTWEHFSVICTLSSHQSIYDLKETRTNHDGKCLAVFKYHMKRTIPQ